jgi:hypothetical protein
MTVFGNLPVRTEGGTMTEGSNGVPDPDAEVQKATKEEEAREGAAPHTADRAPTAAEEAAADRNTLEPGVAEHEREMGTIGAEVKGEGEID